MTKTFSLTILLFLILGHIFAISSTNTSIKHADSLFLIGEKKIALNEYISIITKNKVSNTTLLKATILAEQTQNTAYELLFLNKLYKKTNNNQIQEKIESICEEKEINGHTFSDIHWLNMWYTLYKNKIILICITVITLVITYYAFIFFRKKSTFSNYASPIIVILLTLLLLNNINPTFEKGIIINKNTHIRTSNSGISPIIHKLKKGDAVYIHKQNDIWSKVTIEEYVGYIRTNSIINI